GGLNACARKGIRMAEAHGTGSKDEGLHTPRVRGVPVSRRSAHGKSTRDPDRTLSVNPFVSSAADPLGSMQLAPPMYRIPDHPIEPTTAYRLIHDELMLDGNARLTLATFVTTWME